MNDKYSYTATSSASSTQVYWSKEGGFSALCRALSWNLQITVINGALYWMLNPDCEIQTMVCLHLHHEDYTSLLLDLFHTHKCPRDLWHKVGAYLIQAGADPTVLSTAQLDWLDLPKDDYRKAARHALAH